MQEGIITDKKSGGPVVCLGMEFENDDVRRAYFREQLRQKLQDPQFRNIEGFPIGSDEDILELSDPPYYTACPNPWIPAFIEEWSAQKGEPPYSREPFAADVSEGKNDPIYNAHSYHTKVPHRAIMRYILHYTEPGDIVFDGFCGTGMTGVAAQLCGDRDAVISLGYQVKPDGTILCEAENGKWIPFSRLGSRHAVLNDLSPVATFIAYNFNTPVEIYEFEKTVNGILKKVEKEYGWMYETKDENGRKGKINHTLWSDVFTCPQCSEEIVFWDVAADREGGSVRDIYICPHCGTELTKRDLQRAWLTKYDADLQDTIQQAKQVPVLINYCPAGTSKSREKIPDDGDLAVIQKIEDMSIPYWFPKNPLPKGVKTGEPIRVGFSNLHHLYTKRNLLILSYFLNLIKYSRFKSQLFFCFTSAHQFINRMCRLNVRNFFNKKGGLIGPPLGLTLYVPSLSMETNAITRIKLRSRLSNALIAKNRQCITAQSSSCLHGYKNDSIDYIFIDPPFGANINYSELNYLLEGWLKVFTNNKMEAIENSVQEKGIDEYRKIMTACFKELYRILKPGRWLTVEFSNTNAAVWNSIQTSLSQAGFIVANVSALDKQKGSHNVVTTSTAVKQDLVISAYKPNGGFEARFLQEAGSEEGVWDFVATHLKYLPVVKIQGQRLQIIPERDPRILYDKLVAYYVRKGYRLPLSSQEFQIGLNQRFSERDGMFFLPEQAAEFDSKKLQYKGAMEQRSIFVKDEASAIAWLRQFLKEQPRAFADINPHFMRQLAAWSRSEAQLDLRDLLTQNFLCYDGNGPVPAQLVNCPGVDLWYVPDPNKAADLEKLREKTLLREFEDYKKATKKLRRFRMEAMAAGLKKAWHDQDYDLIIAVTEKIPDSILEEDAKLLMWHDQAITRKEEK